MEDQLAKGVVRPYPPNAQQPSCAEYKGAGAEKHEAKPKSIEMSPGRAGE
jgi:hypothetical protein